MPPIRCHHQILSIFSQIFVKSQESSENVVIFGCIFLALYRNKTVYLNHPRDKCELPRSLNLWCKCHLPAAMNVKPVILP